MKKVTGIPEQEHAARRDPWFDKVFDGGLYELGKADWSPRYQSVRSAASAIKQAGQHRGFDAQVNIRGDLLFVQAPNGTAPVKSARKRAPGRPRKATAKDVQAAAREMGLSVDEVNTLVAPAKKGTAKKVAAKKATARRPPRKAS